jgi:hypothetical protein
MLLGLTSLLAIRLAMVSPSWVKSDLVGHVETVFTFCTHRFRPPFFLTILFALRPVLCSPQWLPLPHGSRIGSRNR